MDEEDINSDERKGGNSLGFSPNARSQISIPEEDEGEKSEMEEDS